MQDDYTDILGSGALNVKPKYSLPFGVKAAFTSFLLLVLYIVGANSWRRFLKWRERSYRLAMRRKHGIPDDDHRPFNVAYAAVQRARQERETLRSAKFKPMNNMPREQPRPSAQPNQDLRQRTGTSKNVETAWMNDHNRVLPGAYDLPISQNATGPKQNINGQATDYLNEDKVIYPRAAELVSSTNYLVPGPIRISKVQKGDAKKRNYVYMDVDQDSNVAENTVGEMSERRQQVASALKRGAKREFGDADETEDVLQSKRAREKRARKVSLEKELPYEEMEVDENELEDGSDIGHISRGKKRDRAEAGSTFGGDDEDQSELGEVQEEDVTRRSRKRRSVVKKKSDLTIAVRGKKRDRDIDDEPSDDGSDQGSNQTSSRKRRNKKEGRFGHFTDDDVLMDDSQAKGGSRKIGEEWTSNGVFYKIGPNGQRLRQALVKKARQKYSMPEDSQHPDRDANLEVYVETWLTEDDYQDAKVRHLLAWQDPPKASVERGPHTETSQPSSPTGKSLLWKSNATPSMSTPESGSPTSEILPPPILKVKGRSRSAHDPRRLSVAVDVVTGVNPFEQNSSQANKRIASGAPRISAVSGASTPGLVDSTNSSPRSTHRIYSKWEKQDLEANAMIKMREASRKKEAEEKERQEKERQEKERAEREKAEKAKAAATPIVPNITVTAPPEDKPTQAENKVPDFFAKPTEPIKEAPKPPAATTPSFSFSKPEEKTTTQTETKAPSLSAATSATPFSFAKPGPSPFMAQTKPAEDNAKVREQPKPSPFTMPPSATIGPTNTASSSPMFSFSKPATAQEPKRPEQNGQTSGPSLLSRLGGTVAGGNGTTTAPSSTPSISFAKPGEAPKSFFSAPSMTTTQAQPAPPTTGATAAALSSTGSPAPQKFDFKFQNTKAPGTLDSAKPTNSTTPFSFKIPAAPSSVSGVAAGPTATTAPKFFGATSNAFGGNGTSQASNGAKGDSNKATISFGNTNPLGSANATFTGFGNNNVTTGNTGGEKKTTVFPTFGNVQAPGRTAPATTWNASSKPQFQIPGSSTGTGAFGIGGTGGFGINGAKPSEPKPMFSFGQSSTPASATPTTINTDAHNSTFNLGNNDASKATTTTARFSFGATNSLNKAGAAEGAAAAVSNAPNPFAPSTTTSGTGSTSTPSVFFGAQPKATGNASSTPFGGASNGLSAFSNAFGNTAGSPANSQPVFGSVPSENPNMTFGAPSVFGNTPSSTTNFGTSSSFTFGEQGPSNNTKGTSSS